MKFVATKTVDQLDLQAMHRVRERLVSQRTGIINQIRAFLLERGVAVRQGLRFWRADLPGILAGPFLGKISKRGNRYLRVLFVQAAWVVLTKPKSWGRHGLRSWIEAAKKRLHRNVLAIALANKLARIAWRVLAHGRSFEASKLSGAAAPTARS